MAASLRQDYETFKPLILLASGVSHDLPFLRRARRKNFRAALSTTNHAWTRDPQGRRLDTPPYSRVTGIMILELIVIRNADRHPDNDTTLFQRPIALIDGVKQEPVCRAHELLTGLHEEGVPIDEIKRMKEELEDSARTSLRSNLLTADTVQKIVAGYART